MHSNEKLRTIFEFLAKPRELSRLILVSVLGLSVVLSACGSNEITPETSTSLPAAATVTTVVTVTTASVAPTNTSLPLVTATVAATPSNSSSTSDLTPVTATPSASSTALATATTSMPPITTRPVQTTPPIVTPVIGSGDAKRVDVESAIVNGKAVVATSMVKEQSAASGWLRYLPNTPGSQLYYYNTCGMQPVNGAENNCKSNVLGTTTATSTANGWQLSFSLTWPGQLPTGMQRPQTVHTWTVAVTATGQASLVSESGGPVPPFVRPL